MEEKTKPGWGLVKDHLRWGDLILVIIVVITIVATSQRRPGVKSGLSIYVYKDNVLIGKYSNGQDRTVKIDEHNSLQIKSGKVRMIEADCRDKRCMKQGWTSSLPIICLPNHLVVEIKQNETDKKLILQ